MVAALRVDEHSRDRLIEAGFNDPIEVGQVVLPSAHLGRASSFNAEGREEVLKDQPKETVYRPVEWTHEQWNGPYTETVTEVVERPYQRYPRTIVAPPSVELAVRRSEDGVLFACAPERVMGRDDAELLHDINLILNLTEECEILSPDLMSSFGRNVRRLSWDVLPAGHHPWARLKTLVRPTLARMPEVAKPVIEHRLEFVSRYPHEFVAIGKAGFAGYVIFGFPALGIYVLECTHQGNATYVFGQDWEALSQMTKAEILRDDLHLHRLIHTRGWQHTLGDVMRQHGY